MKDTWKIITMIDVISDILGLRARSQNSNRRRFSDSIHLIPYSESPMMKIFFFMNVISWHLKFRVVLFHKLYIFIMHPFLDCQYNEFFNSWISSWMLSFFYHWYQYFIHPERVYLSLSSTIWDWNQITSTVKLWSSGTSLYFLIQNFSMIHHLKFFLRVRYGGSWWYIFNPRYWKSRLWYRQFRHLENSFFFHDNENYWIEIFVYSEIEVVRKT